MHTVGHGRDVFLWLDNRHPDGGIVCDAGSNINARDSSVISNDHWC